MTDYNSTIFSMELKIKLGKDEFGTPVDLTKYMSIVGSLRYLTHTRPYITYVVGIVLGWECWWSEKHDMYDILFYSKSDYMASHVALLTFEAELMAATTTTC